MAETNTESLKSDIQKELEMIYQRFDLLVRDYHDLSKYQKTLNKKISEINTKSMLQIKNLRADIQNIKQELKAIDHDLAIIGSWLRFIVKRELVEDIKPRVESIDVAKIIQKSVLKDLL